MQSPNKSQKEKNTSKFVAKEIMENESLVAENMEHNCLKRSILNKKYKNR